MVYCSDKNANVILCLIGDRLKDVIRKLIGDHARLPIDASSLTDSEDLYQAGMTSHASVMLMLGLENEFGVEFPDSMLTRDIFASIDAIAGAITSLQQEAA
jgi:acyl carrier protein